ncbi:8-amino-7-oxononanoate synthase [Streptomyces sp. BK208]|uniref:type I polyketide synthase n=1 Tax=Streptomyces sp. BK208 TaxID=2512150 RepID=UPI0010E98A9E|nr:type I polyketide synthase [Streptomyces sp. BK208]TDT28130.1 8-amino-7-oxononanoate synthase [Streptomyces sp. BK208]
MSQGPTEPMREHWRGPEPETVTALLRHRAEHTPDALAHRFLTDGDGTSVAWTYRELDLHAREVAAHLRREQVGQGPVLLLHPPGLDYLAAFFGCLYAGAVAVPAYPPDNARFGQTVPRLAAIARDSAATHALTTRQVREAVAARGTGHVGTGLDGVRWLVTEDLYSGDFTTTWEDAGLTAESLAFLQYTSGSTATPKGVMVGHGNLVRNLRSIHLRLGHDADSGMVSWLPPYHDMGLIGGILTPVYGGFPAHLMAPATFVRRPLLWLETLSRTGASTSVAPNFGFEQCLLRITPEQRAGLDLSRWRLALNGAEPIRPDTLDRFAEYFAPAGFQRTALLPCYGLAEATLMVTGAEPDEAPVVGTFDAAALEAGTARRPGPDGARTTRVVGCGAAVADVEVAVVDAATGRRVPDGTVAEIRVAGPAVARGYWKRPEAGAEVFGTRVEGEPGAVWLRTGDLGFRHDGTLFVVGRTKDVIIVQGRNIHPQDVEQTAERVCPGLRAGHGAAFGIPTEDGEQLALAYEIGGPGAGDPHALLARLRTAVADEHQVTPHTVVLLKRSSVPRTTSGKIQRRACRQQLLELELPVVAASVVQDGPPLHGTPPHCRDTGTGTEDRTAALVTDALAVANADDRAPRFPRLLTAVRLLAEGLGVPLDVGALLSGPEPDGAGALTELCRTALADAAPAPERTRAQAETWLRRAVAARLGLRPSVIDPTVPFTSLGLDSKQAVALADRFGDWLGSPVTPATLYDHPTVRALAAHVSADAAGSGTGGALAGAAGIRPAEPGGTDGAPHPRPYGSVRRALADEPVAVVGIGCRFPGAPDADSYWRLLRDGRDAVGEAPADRMGDVAGPGGRPGGFLDHVYDFDARFFGISAREAERMDPQQRLLLEVAWQTLEDAAIAPSSLAGTDTGVFVGVSGHDYADLQMPRPDLVDMYSATGNAQSVAAGRLSYFFDLHGPSLALDTACSSSLTAVHTALRSLRDGECGVALAGGVNLMLTPGLSAALARGGMLGPGGRCRTFDDAADGYVRGEGAGLVCLKPLSAALADGDRVHAVLTGSALGHGGRANGLTAPRATAQRAVLTEALARAGVEPGQIDFVEAHGTGTALGDPVEWEALAGVYGRGRPAGSPCLVGSVKTGIGHLEAAAGIAGLIKAVLVVRQREVPPLLHLTTPNRHLDWTGAGLAVPTARRALPARGTVRAGVSSFGFGGTNAHVIVESAPEPAAATPACEALAGPVHALPLSAHTETALTTLAGRYRTHLAAHPGASVAALCRSAGTGRSHLPHRAVLTAGTTAELDAALDALIRSEPVPDVARGGPAHGGAPTVAFLFGGQGTQYPGMGRELYDTHPAFARTLRRADEVLRDLGGIPVTGLLFDPEHAGHLGRTRHCQPALVALEVALAELWTSCGVRPAAVLGHSAGALAAACVAGVLSLEDALTLAVVRGRAMDEQPGEGAMIACVGDPGTVRDAAAGHDQVALAAVNAPRHLVLSGAADEIARLRSDLERAGVTVRPLAVSHAFHSPLMAGAAGPLLEAARAVRFHPPRIPWISDATGKPVQRVDAEYWVRHLLGTVRFAEGFARLRDRETEDGPFCDAFVEIGPHPTLLNLGRSAVADAPASGTRPPLWLPSLRRGAPGRRTLLRSLGAHHCAGGTVDWAALDGEHPPARVPLPHTPFERRTYRFPAPSDDQEGDPMPPQPTVTGTALPDPAGEIPRTVLDTVARVCGYPVADLPAHARLGLDLGFDSLMRTDLHRRLTARFPERAHTFQDLPEDPTVQDIIGRLTAGDDGDGARTGGPRPGSAGADTAPVHPAAVPPPPAPAPQYGPYGAFPAPPHGYAVAAPAPQPGVPYPYPYGYPPHGAPGYTYYVPQPFPAPPVPAPPVPVPARPAPTPVPAAGSAPGGASDPVPAPGASVRQEHTFEDWAEYAELQGRLRQTRTGGANPYGRTHEGFNAALATVDGTKVVNFAAFNYLALSHHPRVRQAAKDAVDRYGTSASATPLLFGETPLHHELEAEIARFVGAEAAIVFAGGHATNVATVGHLFGPEDLVVHDAWIHDSTVRGCILSGARRRSFPHNDWAALDRILAGARASHRRALVVIEGAYSQDGDIPDLPRFIEVKKRHGAMLMIDEAHSIGVLGRTGRGVGEHYGTDPTDVDLWMGTLSKALGSLGGYIAARRPLIEYLKFTAPLHIFSTGISPANAAAALEALRVVQDEPERVARVQELAEFFRAGARARGLDVGVSRLSAVIPVITGDWEKTMALSNSLLERGVNVMPIGYPAVPRDQCRLRFFINADHSEADLEHSLDLLV